MCNSMLHRLRLHWVPAPQVKSPALTRHSTPLLSSRPLPSGNHQTVLRVTNKKNKPSTSPLIPRPHLPIRSPSPVREHFALPAAQAEARWNLGPFSSSAHPSPASCPLDLPHVQAPVPATPTDTVLVPPSPRRAVALPRPPLHAPHAAGGSS